MTRAGRPRLSSRSILEDAAHELFLEQGYAATTVDQIAQRAGVGRNTFFNYYSAKSDVLWIEVDDALDALPTALNEPSEDSAPRRVTHAILAAAATIPAHRVPWAVSQAELLALGPELASSGVHRLSRGTQAISDAVSQRPERPTLRERALAHACAGAALAGGIDWVRAGRNRGALTEHLEQALAPVLAGFEPIWGGAA
ncbi:MAG: TetR/AcrR family transcriptional regulator [Mycetocola sp.]